MNNCKKNRMNRLGDWADFRIRLPCQWTCNFRANSKTGGQSGVLICIVVIIYIQSMFKHKHPNRWLVSKLGIIFCFFSVSTSLISEFIELWTEHLAPLCAYMHVRKARFSIQQPKSGALFAVSIEKVKHCIFVPLNSAL